MNTEERKIEIASIANELVLTHPHFPINPELVAKEEGITFCYGNYGDTFDGLLQYENGKFHIFINLDRVKSPHSERARFTFAHELGHYFIDTHRNTLKKGIALHYVSNSSVNQKKSIEKEADYFAACLLMPESKFRGFCIGRPLSGNLINSVSSSLKVSKSAVVYRSFALNMFPMALISSKAGKIVWLQKKSNFDFLPPPSGALVPITTVAGEFHMWGKRYTREEIVYEADWSKNCHWLGNPLFEKCFYLPNNSVLSVVWPK